MILSHVGRRTRVMGYRQLTCGRHRAIFLSAPNARTPFSFQSAAAGCLLAPADRY
jgi:hypothetical protein